ncbi:retrovirus-related pol polyprotein from transposon TNT 1-94 [Tanacetum coccineum]
MKECSWIKAIQEKIHEFGRLQVWELVPRPDYIILVNLKWIFKDKYDEFGGVLKNKVGKCRTNMTSIKMDCQDCISGIGVTKGSGLCQSVEACEVCRSRLSHLRIQIMKDLYGFKTGSHVLDDIIFASTNLELYKMFANITSSNFKMSMMGKMSFFLGLQISQNTRGIFINQSKYALEMIKKYGMESSDPLDTLMVERIKLDEDPHGIPVDPTRYHSMVGSFMYLTSRA